MVHRHLNHEQLTLAAIDDAISRGNREDWAELRKAVLADGALLKKVLQVCRAHAADPRAQRYHFWMHYAMHARHRFSRDADHVLTDLRERFDEILAQLESVAGWKTARVQRPVQILGSLDGIGCIRSPTTRPRCSSYKSSWPTHCPTIWRRRGSRSTRTWRQSGRIGQRWPRRARAARSPFSMGLRLADRGDRKRNGRNDASRLPFRWGGCVAARTSACTRQ
jgi:hypothetical protein